MPELAVITGASSGIGYELAKQCAEHGFDVVIAADEPEIDDAAKSLAPIGARVQAVQADLGTEKGIKKLCSAIGGRPVAALLANAGIGLGRAFLDQEWNRARKVIDVNITGTIALVQHIARGMRARQTGRILFTGSIAGFMPGSFSAVYNGTKAFIDSFAEALRNELKDSGVTVTCLMPGPTDTKFFERGDMMDTKVGTEKKDDPAAVAQAGFAAMMAGKDSIVFGLSNKIQVAGARILPQSVVAETYRREAKPGTAKKAKR